MAAAVNVKTQTNQPSKPKRRKRRETTISTSASSPAPSSSASDHHHHHNRQLNPPTVVSPDNSWCCSATITSKPLTCPPPTIRHTKSSNLAPQEPNPSNPISPSSFKLRFSPGRVSPIMDSPIPGVVVGSYTSSYPSSYTKFNSALNAGLLNPMSPPPPLDKARSNPTVCELMANEVDSQPRGQIPNTQTTPLVTGKPPLSIQEKQLLLHQRVDEILGSCSPGNQFNDPSLSDVKFTLSSKDGLSVTMNVHRQILVGQSRLFAAKLSDKWCKQQRSLPYVVEISDCEDVEVYIETLRLMYCKDIRRKLMKEDVSKVLGILKVSAAIAFDTGVLSCLEYLEAVPWAEDEEEKVALLLSQLHLEGAGADNVLKRVSVEAVTEPEEGSNNGVVLKLLQVVLEGKDEKARREMKVLVSKMLRESSSQNDLSKESLYSAFDGCLQLLRSHFLQAASSDLKEASQIARQADNLHWILDIMIDRLIADDFLKTWAEQSELSEVHSKIPVIHRYEVSRVTGRLFVGIGKGQVLASKEVRCLLLQTWLGPFYDDFGWIRQASKGGLDRHLVEDGLCNTILTLPLAWQQDILLAWFSRFLNSGEDCPNIQRGFQVWWRRAFWRRNGEPERLQSLRPCENS